MNNENREILISAASASLQQCFENLFRIWTEIGVTDNDFDARGARAVNFFKEIFEKAVSCELQEKIQFENEVAMTIEKIGQLEKGLDLHQQNTFTPNSAWPILRLKTEASARLEELQNVQNERLQELKELAEAEMDLCEELEVPSKCPKTECPRPEEIQQVRNHIELLTGLRLERQEEFNSCLSKIEHLRKELEDPTIGPKFWDQPLCPRTLEELQELIRVKNCEVRQNFVEGEKMIERLEYLHALMELSFRRPPNCRPSQLENLRKLLSECEEMKNTHIETVIRKLRKKIADVWELCFCSEDERRRLSSFNEQKLFNEQTLRDHEDELEKITKRYELNRDLYDSIGQWKKLMEAFREFAVQSADPERFKRRGYSMAKEAEKRKKFQSQIPKLESRIKELIREYELNQNESFNFFGRAFPVVISEEHARVETTKTGGGGAKTQKSANASGAAVRAKNASSTRTPFSSIRKEKPQIRRMMAPPPPKPCRVLEASFGQSPKRTPGLLNRLAARAVRRSINHQMFKKMRLCAVTSTPENGN